MSHSEDRPELNRRTFLAGAAGATVAGLAGKALAQGNKTGVDAATWTPEHIASIAGTAEYDTAAECAKVVPLDYKGQLSYWYFGPNQASPQIEHELDAQFWDAFGKLYPNITGHQAEPRLQRDARQAAHRRARQGGADGGATADPVGRRVRRQGPAARVQAGGVRLQRASEFWPGALKSVTWNGKTYGVPTNNETMALIWNAEIFKDAGLDPETPPATWDDVVTYSAQIKEKTGKNGYGMVARVNAGNTPFRFMPQLWAYGGGALDEAEAEPDLQDDLRSTTTGGDRGAAGVTTTCMCATSRCRPRR